MAEAFFQLWAPPEDRKYLAVTRPSDGQKYQFTCWPFGFAWSPHACQRWVEVCLAGPHPEFNYYMDDCTLGTAREYDGEPWEDVFRRHARRWHAFLVTCRTRGIVLGKSKASLFRRVLPA